MSSKDTAAARDWGDWIACESNRTQAVQLRSCRISTRHADHACTSRIKMGILTAAESLTELALRMSAAESSCFRPDQVSHYLSPVGTAADLHC